MKRSSNTPSPTSTPTSASPAQASNASAVPSLKQFVREVTFEVPSPKGGSVHDQWVKDQAVSAPRRGRPAADAPDADKEVRIGTLGSGSDYTPFIQHLGVPSTDIGSDGPYGVYHSVFDNYNWFIRNADPTFVYEQQQARVFGLEILHMADTDVLPYDYSLYGREVLHYVAEARQQGTKAGLSLDLTAVQSAAERFAKAGAAIHTRQLAGTTGDASLNRILREAESALLNPDGLPNRPWFKHTIYAPGEFTGYAAVVIPGVTEAIEVPDAGRAQAQLAALAAALNRSAAILEAVAH